MTTPLLLLGIIVIVPIVLTILLRVNAPILFMSICVGAVLVQYATNDTSVFFGALSPRNNVDNNTVKLVLLLAPAVLTLLFMFHSLSGGSKVLLNIIPAIGVGMLLSLLLEPLLPPGTRGTLSHSNVWRQITQAQTLIVVSSAFINLLFLWFQRRGSGGHQGHGHKSKH